MATNLRGMFMKLVSFLSIGLLSLPVMAAEIIEQSIVVPANNKIFIENDQGNIKVTGWDSSEMKVTGRLDERAKGVVFRNRGDRTEFVVEMPNRYKNSNGKGSDLVIYVPKTQLIYVESVNADMDIKTLDTGVVIDTVNGDVEIESVSGRINLDTVNGDIRSQNLSGKIRIETVNGDIKDDNSQGEMRFEAVNGDLESATNADDIRIETVNGDVDITAKIIKNLDITTVGGEVEVEMQALTKGAHIQAESVNGDVILRLPKSLSAEVEIAAHAGGKIKNGISSHKVNKAKYGPSSSLEFQLGDGDVEIEIDTVNGRVELKHN